MWGYVFKFKCMFEIDMTIHIYITIFVHVYIYILSTYVVKKEFICSGTWFVSFQIQKNLCFFQSKHMPHISYYFFSLPNNICCTTIFKVLYVCSSFYCLNFRTWILGILASEHHGGKTIKKSLVIWRLKLCVPNVVVVPNDGISGSHKS